MISPKGDPIHFSQYVAGFLSPSLSPQLRGLQAGRGGSIPGKGCLHSQGCLSAPTTPPPHPTSTGAPPGGGPQAVLQGPAGGVTRKTPEKPSPPRLCLQGPGCPSPPSPASLAVPLGCPWEGQGAWAAGMDLLPDPFGSSSEGNIRVRGSSTRRARAQLSQGAGAAGPPGTRAVGALSRWQLCVSTRPLP